MQYDGFAVSIMRKPLMMSKSVYLASHCVEDGTKKYKVMFSCDEDLRKINKRIKRRRRFNKVIDLQTVRVRTEIDDRFLATTATSLS